MSSEGSRMVEAGVPILASILGLGILGFWTSTWFTPIGVEARNLDTGKPKKPPVTGTPLTNLPPPGSPASAAGGQAVQPRAVSAAPSGAPAPAAVSAPPMPGEWPSFRGANRDNVAPPEVKVPNSVQGFGIAWKVQLGEGYAAPCVKDGKVYLLDFDSAAKQDVLRCFALADGRELWRNAYPADLKRNHGISRTIPATDGKVVVSLGPKGMLLCTDAGTGQTKWSIDLVAQYGTTIPEWYAGQCPLIENGRAIIAPAGSALMVAFDLATGKPVWSAPNPKGWTMTHSSITPVEVAGERQYVYCGSGGVASVSAKDGKILWQTEEWVVNTATVPSPVPVGGGKVFLCGGYDSGSMMLQIAKAGASWSVKTLFKLEASVFGSDQQTPILYKDHLYGVAPNGELVCLTLDGKRVWGSGTGGRFGLGPYVIADGKIIVFNDHGALTLAEASPAGFKSFGKVQALQGRESWGPLAIAGDRLLARDFTSLVCIRMGGS